jgi:hypothetical protein
MNGWFNPDNTLDLISQALLILGGLAIAIVPSWFAARTHREMKSTQTTVGQVRDQVVNGHEGAPPLRADLDRVITAIDRLARDVSAIRRDLADEETRRRDHVTELREEVHRRISEIHRKLG